MKERETAPDGDASSSRPALFAGVGGGLAAATCCVGPAIEVASGASAGSFLLAMGAYRPLLFAIGGAISLVVTVSLVRRRRAACATSQGYRRLRSQWVTGALAAFAVTYALGRFVVAPLIERL